MQRRNRIKRSNWWLNDGNYLSSSNYNTVNNPFHRKMGYV